MPTNAELVDAAKSAALGNYNPAPIVLTRGAGRRVWDVEGRTYLDLCAGIAVLSVGHSHPVLADAIAEQARRLMHVSNLFYNDRAIELATQLTRRSDFARAFFCNSGTEANETMLKLARRWHHEHGHGERTDFVCMEHSFHGRTLGSLSVTGQAKYRVGLGPLLGGVRTIPFDDLVAAKRAIGPTTAAVIVEPLLAEGGILVPSDGYLAGLRRLCDAAGALLLFDEVQTGYGRTGRFLAREHSGVMPDACSVAKGIAGGFPFGATLISERLADGLPPGSHASTFGGNALACAAGLAVLRIFDEEGLVQASETRGQQLADHFARLLGLSAVASGRGLGLLRGLTLADDVPPRATLAAVRDRGVLLSLAGGNVLRFSPPLNVTGEEIDEGVAVVEAVLRDPPRKEL